MDFTIKNQIYFNPIFYLFIYNDYKTNSQPLHQLFII